jgi:hypothetical protein
MERASEKAYISKKDLEIYQRERAKLLKKKLAAQEGVPFDEKEEEIKEPAVIDEAELSAEEVDSDDLGDDITQKKKRPAKK